MLQYTMTGYVKKELQLFLKCIAVQYMIDAVQMVKLMVGAVRTQNGVHYNPLPSLFSGGDSILQLTLSQVLFN